MDMTVEGSADESFIVHTHRTLDGIHWLEARYCTPEGKIVRIELVNPEFIKNPLTEAKISYRSYRSRPLAGDMLMHFDFYAGDAPAELDNRDGMAFYGDGHE